MITFLKWPDEFDSPIPLSTFGDRLTDVLTELVEFECEVIAEQHWSWFSVSREGRMIDLVCRGRLRHNRNSCWEVRLSCNDQPVPLGGFFGIREHACVVISGIDDLRTLTNLWLAGAEIHSLLRSVIFWDRMDSEQPLQLRAT